MAKYFGIYESSEDIQNALNEGDILKPYVALVDGSLDYNTLEPAEYPADNEIWYFGNEQITMNELCPDYSHITSHTFANGKGVITFDEDLTEFSDSTNGGLFTDSGSPGFNCSQYEVVFPDSLITINDLAFSDAPNLTNITFGASTEHIGVNGYPWKAEEIAPIVNITCRATVPPVIRQMEYLTVFGHLAHIYVPAESVDTYKAADGWSAVAFIIEAISQ